MASVLKAANWLKALATLLTVLLPVVQLARSAERSSEMRVRERLSVRRQAQPRGLSGQP